MKVTGLTKAEQAESILNQLDTDGTKFRAMTYEQGIDVALRWMLNEIETEDLIEGL